jgi:hypothetical protein
MRRWALTILCLVIVLSGCRSASPVAPKQEVDSVLSSLGLYCGRAIQLEAFGERAARLDRLDSAATRSARRLLRIARANPEATYLGLPMRRVVRMAASETRRCNLSHAHAVLSPATEETAAGGLTRNGTIPPAM